MPNNDWTAQFLSFWSKISPTKLHLSIFRCHFGDKSYNLVRIKFHPEVGTHTMPMAQLKNFSGRGGGHNALHAQHEA